MVLELSLLLEAEQPSPLRVEERLEQLTQSVLAMTL
jgi:hypothetical protein